MVYIKDEGSTFDAPVGKVWEYLQAPEHVAAHVNARNHRDHPLNEITIVLDEEERIDGSWAPTKTRLTFLPPVGLAFEILEGPLAGSKYFNYYVPHGSKTEVVVVGDFASPKIPQAKLEKVVREYLDMLFEEDHHAIG